MSYVSVNLCANDEAFIGRLRAAAAKENAENPDQSGYGWRWPVSAKSDIEAAYESALAGGNPNPGGDESVITDGMILAAVQSIPTP